MAGEPESIHLRRALQLARRGRYAVAPNPMVGAVVARDGEPVGEGYHRRAGGAHAEVEALARAAELAHGADLFVNLEPCAHRGRTPPCTEAILAAGIRRVVALHRDPNPEVAGGGLRRLAEAGLEVSWGPAELLEPAVRLNWRFLTAAVHQRPAVTIKWAMSLDGRIATSTGESQWISSPEGRRWALGLREEHDAVLVGSGTVLADDPRLDRRLGRAAGPNVRVVMDRRLRLEPTARLLSEPGEVVVYTAAGAPRSDALRRRGALIVEQAEVTPWSVLEDLYGRGVRSVLVEGGGEIAFAFVEVGAFDRVAVDCAPLLIGGRRAAGALGGRGFSELRLAARLAGIETRRRGGEVILSGFRERCLADLCSSVAG